MSFNLEFAKVLRSTTAFLIIALLLLHQAAFALSDVKKELPKKTLVSSGVVISQVYGGGGNAGAPLNADFVELFNRGTTPISLNGWSIQYGSAAGTGNFGASATAITELPNVTLSPGQYYLVQEASGATGSALPTPDLVDPTPIAMSGTAGKVALASIATTLGCNGGSNPCNAAQLANIVDLVGFGAANFFEGAAPTGTLSNTTAAIRNGSGCVETDQNGADFSVAAPTPRNTATTSFSCSGGPTNPSGVGAATPPTVVQGGSTKLTVTVTPGTNPASSSLAVVANLTSIGGSETQSLFDDGTNGDVTIGDNIFSFQATVDIATTTGAKVLPSVISDFQGRTGNANISLTVNPVTGPPTGVGAANPSSLLAGNATLLTVNVTPGTNPTSTGIAVVGDLGAIGGSAIQAFFDDGTNGDVTLGDNIFSFGATVNAATTPGAKNLPVTITDAQSRTGNTNISLTITSPPSGGQTLPFSQNWSNTGLITTDNDWSGVPGIIGYRGDGMAGATAVDPQTILQDGSSTPVAVVANNTNPNGSTSGGLAEFEITDPVVGFQGSGTSRAPHIVISINTVGATNVTASYNLRDVDGSTDNSVQPVALQYRIGNTGSFTNVPAAFVADASSGPSIATQVTPVGVLLPAAIENQPLVQLRIITADAIGSDEWIGIDDIIIASNGTLPLAASGNANPNLVNAGTSALLTVSVNPATNPISSGLSVVTDLSTIGGSSSQQFFDDGTNGDVTIGDRVFSFSALIGAAQAGGPRSLPVSVTDAQARTASTTIVLTVRAATDPQVHITMGNPSGAVSDIGVPNNYLILRDQYVQSYNRDRSQPNWVAWHLDTSWIGGAQRQDDFRADASLPVGWYQVTEFDFSGTGFDRGHHTPSGDRTASIADNSATFLMSNMMPQAPDNNQGPWEELESHSRSIMNQGNELYIYMGGVGIGGTGSVGGVTNTVANGHVTVPSYTWKVIMVLPNGAGDVARVDENTRAIAVIMPNRQGIREEPWNKYLATVDQVEALTGYDFFSNVPEQIQDVIESRLDTVSNTLPQTLGAGTFTDLRIDYPNTTLTGNVTVNGNLVLGGSTLKTGANRIMLGPNATITRISGMVDGSLEKQFNGSASFEYTVGTSKGYSPLNVQVTNVSVPPSSLTVSSVDGVHPQAPQPLAALNRFWKITETGDLTANLSFRYLDGDVPSDVEDESTFRLQKFDGAFSEIPSSIDVGSNTVTTTGISSFSDWTLFGSLAPVASSTVSGRVTTSAGFSFGTSIVSLTDIQGNVRSVRTNTFGYFNITGIPTGATYTLNVKSKSFVFNPVSVQVTGNVTGLDIRANP